MGSIVRFPESRRPLGGGRFVGADAEPGRVIILPVIRIERPGDTPAGDLGNGSDTPRPRKRRRASRT